MIVHDPDRRISFPIWCPAHKSQGGELFVQIGIGHGSAWNVFDRCDDSPELISLEFLAAADMRNGRGGVFLPL